MNAELAKNEQQPVDGEICLADYAAKLAEERAFYIGRELDAWLKAEHPPLAERAEQTTCLI